MARIDAAVDLDRALAPDTAPLAVLSTRAIVADAPPDDDLDDVLDWLDLGVILTDAAARPLRLNRRAEAIVAHADGLFAEPSGVAAAFPDETCRLRHAVAMANLAGTRLRLTRPSGRRPLLLTVIAVRDGIAGLRTHGPLTAIFIMDPDRGDTPDPALLQELFGLTAAEAIFAAEISRGDGLQAVADRLAIAPTTARTHLTRIFEKTGTRRQAELVRLLMQCDRLAPAAPALRVSL
jgi:DNA-binding CsgD family transcriptional regulator